MRRLVFFAVLLAGCHALDRTLDLEIHKRNEAARRALEETQIGLARDLYATVLEIQPEEPTAAAGWALADLLSVLDSEPVRAFLERCNQPYFDVASAVFGPDGLLSREDRADLGSVELATIYKSSAEATGADLPWITPTVRSEIVSDSLDDSAVTSDYLTIVVRDAASGRSLELQFNTEDVLKDDGVVTPLVSGLEIALEEADGKVSIFESIDAVSARGSEVAASGRVRFHAFGTRAGDQIAVEIIDAVIPSFCIDLPCSAHYLVSGTIEDEVSVVQIPRERVPFGTIRADEGPPFAQELIVAIELCDPIDDQFLADRIGDLGDVLDRQAQRFAIAGNRPGFSFAVPMRLLHTDRDLVINETDAHALAGALFAAAAIAEMISQYRWFGGELHELISTFVRGSSEVRDFEPRRTVMKLRLFEPRESFSLTIVEERLERSLTSIEKALTIEPGEAGVFEFQHHTVRKLASDWAELARTLRMSIISDAPLAPESAPLHRVHLRELFEDPPTHQNAAGRLGVDAIVWANDDPYEIAFADELIERWYALFGDAILFPPDRPEQRCTSPVDCEVGYTCGPERHCIPETPFLFSERALEAVSDEADGGWPRFVNPLIRQIIDFGI